MQDDDQEPPEVFDPVEDYPWRTPREIFARFGFIPIVPSLLDDRQLSGRLWELLYAAAASRFFFSHTDHLSDREFYALLWDQWLDEPTADIPLSAETNTHTDISAFNALGLIAEEIWLRYYADEDDQLLWRSTEPGFVFPPHQDPPHDRDRFLPVPPISLEAHAGWLPGDELPPEPEDSDPLGLAAIDREIAAASDDVPVDLPPADPIATNLETSLRASEPDTWISPAKKFEEEKTPLLPPAEITDETLTPILWELLHQLALRGFYVLHTDHLSDRDLYGDLWHHGLRDPAHLPGRNPRGGWFHDFLGSWGDAEMQLWLRYYATDEERTKHATEFPGPLMPPKETPIFQRDWRVPKGPF